MRTFQQPRIPIYFGGSSEAAYRVGARHADVFALWGEPLAETASRAGNSTVLVGTPETVAQAILDYVDIGVSTILIRGYDPFGDAVQDGRELLPLVRAEVKRDGAASTTS